jgi:hypothetical protein
MNKKLKIPEGNKEHILNIEYLIQKEEKESAIEEKMYMKLTRKKVDKELNRETDKTNFKVVNTDKGQDVLKDKEIDFGD